MEQNSDKDGHSPISGNDYNRRMNELATWRTEHDRIKYDVLGFRELHMHQS